MLPASNYPHGVPLSPGEQIKLHRRYEHWASIEINWHYLRSWIIHAKLCRSEILVLLSQPKNRFCMIRWHSARLKYLWLSYSPRISHTQRIGWPDVRMYVACCYICVSTKPEIILDWMEYRTSPFASSHTHTHTVRHHLTFRLITLNINNHARLHPEHYPRLNVF